MTSDVITEVIGTLSRGASLLLDNDELLRRLGTEDRFFAALRHPFEDSIILADNVVRAIVFSVEDYKRTGTRILDPKLKIIAAASDLDMHLSVLSSIYEKLDREELRKIVERNRSHIVELKALTALIAEAADLGSDFEQAARRYP